MPPPVNITAKKAKLFNSRTIRTDLIDPNYKDGKLSVSEFLNSRSFEIQSLEKAKLKAKFAGANRCFQSLPRTLRRRTASHNVKRIPKRLRNRAIREMLNTTNGVPPRAKLPRGKALYKLKMATKLLKLAARIKELRGGNTADMQNVKLRLRIKMLTKQKRALQEGRAETKLLNNSMGSYDNTGMNELAPLPKGSFKYSKRQREYVWLPTHIWHTKRAHLIKQHGYQIPYSPTQKCFKLINRASKHDSVCYDTSYYDVMIVTTASRLALLNDITKFTNFPEHLFGKSYDDWLFIGGEPLGRGTIFCFGDKVLIRVHPSLYESLFAYIQKKFPVQDCRYSIGSIEFSGPNAMQSMTKVLHPLREKEGLSEPLKNWFGMASCNDTNNTIPAGTTFSFSVQDPRLWSKPTNPPKGDSSNLNQLIAEQGRTIDNDSISQLLDNNLRDESYRDQMSIKELSKRANGTSNSSSIPLLITKLKTSGNWCVMLPWYWVLPLWIELVKVTNLKFGGLLQLHQVNFENGRATFPTDFPFLKDGYLENEFNIQENTKKFENKPKSHKMDLSESEHGNPHGSDWRYLQLLTFGLEILSRTASSEANSFGSFKDGKLELKSITDLTQLIKQAKSLDLESKARGELLSLPVCLYEKKKHGSIKDLELTPAMKFPPLPVVQIKITLANKGNPNQHARIYRCTSGGDPNVEDLIGFVTSGTFNLNLGKGTCIGNINGYFAKQGGNENIYIRNIGCTIFRLAKWECI